MLRYLITDIRYDATEQKGSEVEQLGVELCAVNYI